MSELKVTVNKNGPYKVEGIAALTGADGAPLELREGKAVFLCRCGHSANKPFCDGSHKEKGFLPDGD